MLQVDRRIAISICLASILSYVASHFMRNNLSVHAKLVADLLQEGQGPNLGGQALGSKTTCFH
jgi:hypothetical protein